MKSQNFTESQPKLSLFDYFKGKTSAWGIFEDRFGNIRRQFQVDIEGLIDGNVLILDEPTFGLGWNQKVKLRSFLRDCMSNMHFIIISHDQKFIHSICDTILDFNDQKVRQVSIGERKET